MERITSRANPLIAHVERLSGDASYRAEHREFVCEGQKLIPEALAAGLSVHTAIVHESIAPETLPDGIERVVIVPDSLYARVSTLKNARSVLFVCGMRPTNTPIYKHGQVLCLDGVQDPGNVGTILRTADAFGVDAVWMTGACADVYNPKTVRATMGSVFRVPVFRGDADGFLNAMKEAQIPVYATALAQDSRDIRTVSLSPAAVIIGSEGSGVSPYLQTSADARVIIPMRGVTESLNAAIAASLVCWMFAEKD